MCYQASIYSYIMANDLDNYGMCVGKMFRELPLLPYTSYAPCSRAPHSGEAWMASSHQQRLFVLRRFLFSCSSFFVFNTAKIEFFHKYPKNLQEQGLCRIFAVKLSYHAKNPNPYTDPPCPILLQRPERKVCQESCPHHGPTRHLCPRT